MCDELEHVEDIDEEREQVPDAGADDPPAAPPTAEEAAAAVLVPTEWSWTHSTGTLRHRRK